MNWYFEHAGWLYTKIYQNDFFFFDLWSIVHCWSGFIIFLALKSLRVKKTLGMLLTFLFLYELLEITFTYIALDIFKPETIKDQFTDIIIGMVGGIIGHFICRFTDLTNKVQLRNLNFFTIFLASITYSWLWVGFYQYNYNQEFYNSPGINIGAFFFWVFGAFATIWGSTLIRFQNAWLKWSALWAIYLVGLFAVEYFGYEILDLHESSKPGSQALLFGLIHGTPVLHFVYLVSPAFTISIYYSLKSLLLKAIKTEQIRRFSDKIKEERINVQQISLQPDK